MPTTIEPAVLTKTNILVVDDRPDGLLALEAVLACDSYNLIKASSGLEALSQLLYHEFAVILLDVQMPELDGFETARLIRESPRSKETPIIFVTAISKDTRNLYQGYEAGAVDYIFKPLDPFILKSKVSIFVDLFNKNLQIKQQAELLRKMELREKERQIMEMQQENTRRYVNLADAVPHIILKIRPDGKIEYLNQRGHEYAGSASGVDWQPAIHPRDRRRFISFWQRMREQDLRTSEIELRLRGLEDSAYQWHLVRIVAEVKHDQIIGWICTCTDIDNIKKTEETFRLLSRELNRSNKELEEFAYIASHDLKEPLRVVSSFVSLLEKRVQSKVDQREREYLGFIKEGTQQAQTLIKELLEYSRIGKEKSFETIDLSSLVNEVLTGLKIAIRETGAVITHDPLPKVEAHHIEMVQLFQNLISNAIHYRSDQPLKVHISVRPQGGRWIFSIKDNGIGIDPQFNERIFGMFQRLQPKTETSGTGIGLAICKKIVENHGGEIWVESRVEHGATFYFTLKRTT